MKKTYLLIALSALLLAGGTGCKKYLNINSDPDTIQNPSVSSVLPAILSATGYGIQRDGRYVSHYIANFGVYSSAAAESAYDAHGYTFSSTNSGDLWWMTYYLFGKNVNFIIEKGLNNQQYDYVAAAYAMKAWAFQTLTDYSGEIIFKEAWKDDTYYFHYDSQDTVYHGIDSLCRVALGYLDLAKNMSVKTLSKGDFVYNGDLTKWRKFVYGILAHNYGHLTNKTGIFQADSVIKYCDSSFASVSDDFNVPFDATRNDNANFWGTYRNNLGNYRQSNFIVRLLDGTTLAGTNTNPANRDPRMPHMLCASSDTTNGNGGYYGVDPATSEPYVSLNPPGSYLVNGQPPTSGTALTNWKNARKKTCVPWGDSTYTNPSASVFNDGTGKYLFRNRAVMPLMTYAELQFIKSEAAFKKADNATAYAAYLNGINAHFDFINRNYSTLRASVSLYNNNPISPAARAAYLAGDNVKHTSTSLTISDIMLQKYIALWGWGFIETWCDLRRYHWITDLDPATSKPVFRNYQLATGVTKPVYRVRPNYQSEYVWNLAELQRIGATRSDYHQQECWFSKP